MMELSTSRGAVVFKQWLGKARTYESCLNVSSALHMTV